ASVLKRPLILPKTPNFLLDFLLGEMSAIVLESQRVSSRKIEDQGFEFKFYEIETALDDLL
ncbi:MAG: DUF1731 domain-containing protein, partial [Flavobacteriaceae bacterium]|nr:DUF1731 domain-containing protein [Flavobacteriaceae bacterium]